MNLKKFSLVVMSTVLLFTLISPSLAAAEEVADMELQGEIMPLKEGKVLTKETLLQVAQKHIEGYLKDDIQTKGRIVQASENFVPLYDLEDHIFAYLVPLLEGEQEIGYITLGAIEDGYDAYDIFIKDNAVSSILGKLNDKTSSARESTVSNEAKLIFLPPMQYVIQTTDDSNQIQYFDISNDTQPEVNITSAVEANRSDIQHQYDRIRNEENRQQFSRLMEDAPLSTLASVTPENVSLTVEANFGMFIPVEYSSGIYSYGGDQGWYTTSTKQDRGCGPVAAANITNYLATIKNPTTYGALYNGSTLSKANFLTHMNTLYDYVSPGILGKISVDGFASAVEKYASDKKVKLNRVESSTSFTLDNTANYVKAGLAINSPVATLNLSKWSDYEYEWHWMTITKYYRDSTDSRWIAVSTWGERRSINYRTHFDAIVGFKSLGGGFMYFK